MADTRIAPNPTDLARLALMTEASVTEADRSQLETLLRRTATRTRTSPSSASSRSPRSTPSSSADPERSPVIEAVERATQAGEPVAEYDRGRLEPIRLDADGDDLRRVELFEGPGPGMPDGSDAADTLSESSYSRGREIADQYNGINITTPASTQGARCAPGHRGPPRSGT